MHIGHVARMSVSGYRGRLFEPRQHRYVMSLSKTLYPHRISRLSCEMSTRWIHPREGCSVLSSSEEISLGNHAFIYINVHQSIVTQLIFLLSGTVFRLLITVIIFYDSTHVHTMAILFSFTSFFSLKNCFKVYTKNYR